jgi:FkbM family methyltransferase
MRPYLLRAHHWEETEAALLRSLLRPGDHFLDVGANVGYFSLFAFHNDPWVTMDAVEPLPDSVTALRWNMWFNKVPATIHPCALDERRRTLSLTVAPSNIGDTRVSAPSGAAGEITVDAVPGDELFAGRTFDVVKLDVQGWEGEVIRGMSRTIERSRDIAIVAEYWPAALRDRDVEPLEVLDLHAQRGLDIVVQVDDTLRRLEPAAIVKVCDDAGPYGQVNLLLRKR